ncbi:DUF4386 domain-containing protein [Agromyces sp. MMS24-JH15]|uniref:DUF4386 domain-containing protein n=1 Tax=Agromyces sp. MMS24-JH15 TaxID=3243765 RepID=UPI0037486283
MRPTTLTGLLLIASAIIVNTAFAVLGAVFDYPDVLQHAPADVLARFAEQPVLIGGTFALLALGAAMLAPVAVRLSRHFPAGRVGTAAAIVGMAASAVQVVGLLRWPLIVPWIAAAVPGASTGDRETLSATFTTLHAVLGTVIGETLGYLLTAAWTVLAVIALRRAGAMARTLAVIGLASAGLILAGLLVPFDVPLADQANFIGYVLWSGWLVAVGVLTILRGRAAGSHAAPSRVAGRGMPAPAHLPRA